MYTIIGLALIALVFGIMMKDLTAVIIFPIMGGFIGFLIALFGNAVTTPEFKHFTTTYEIVAMNDNSGVSGWYMAMTPSMAFAMYIKTENGYRLITQDNNATVKFDNINPRIEFTYKEGIPDNADNFLMWRFEKRQQLTGVVIYVPENSIKKDFVLDAK